MAFIIDENRTMSITRGDSGPFDVNMVKGKGSSEYELADGATLTFTVKRSSADGEEALIQKVATAANGGASFTIDPADTRALAVGRYKYQVKLVTALGEEDTITGVRPLAFVVCESLA